MRAGMVWRKTFDSFDERANGKRFERGLGGWLRMRDNGGGLRNRRKDYLAGRRGVLNILEGKEAQLSEREVAFSYSVAVVSRKKGVEGCLWEAG